ncbi:MAG: DinB family protein [Acidobacteria bacterium]|nr:DinB family protein [Acidobacteriota bacterium]
MRQLIRICLALFIAGLVGGQKSIAAECDVVGPLQQRWEGTRNLVIPLAEAFPEEKYDYKPTPEVRSFREQLIHLISENQRYMAMVAGEAPKDQSQLERLTKREEILKTLVESYDYGTRVLSNLDEQKAMEMIPVPSFLGQQMARWSVVMWNIVDNMDHYGNLVVYLRLNKIVPPRSAGQQRR